MMTRKDYIAVSEILRGARNRVQDDPLHVTAHDVLWNVGDALADYMAEDNDRFSRDTFMKASGLARKEDN
jgi:hypothetical protein